MKTETVLQIIAIAISIIVPTIGGLYAIITNTKKFELRENYYRELLLWYKITNETVVRIITSIDNNEFYTDDFSRERNELISKLSSLIEEGRFYFPNIIRKDDFGWEKPFAYQGYRHIVLEFLVFIYDEIAVFNNTNTERIEKARREFTSFVFKTINPRKRIGEYAKYSNINCPNDMAIEEYIISDAQSAEIFYL